MSRRGRGFYRSSGTVSSTASSGSEGTASWRGIRVTCHDTPCPVAP